MNLVFRVVVENAVVQLEVAARAADARHQHFGADAVAWKSVNVAGLEGGVRRMSDEIEVFAIGDDLVRDGDVADHDREARRRVAAFAAFAAFANLDRNRVKLLSFPVLALSS